MIVTCHFFHPAKKLRSGAIVRFSDNSSFLNFRILTISTLVGEHDSEVYL